MINFFSKRSSSRTSSSNQSTQKKESTERIEDMERRSRLFEKRASQTSDIGADFWTKKREF